MRHHFPLRRTDSSPRVGRLDEDEREPTPSHGSRRRRSDRRGGGPGAPVDRKAMQLCHQVAVTLDEVLAECGDPLLQGLRVLNVKPSPDVSRLVVTLSVDDEPEEVLHRVEDHLARASNHLRCEVAQSITRKRAPSLVYHLALGEPEA